MSANGSPQSATPTANHEPSRRVPTSSDAARDPITAPTPTAVMRRPTPGSPVPSSSIATTTESTVSAPRVNDCAPTRPRTRARSRLPATARMPSAASLARAGRLGAGGRGGASYRRRSSSAAAHSEAPAATANTTATFVYRSSTAASSGPTRVAAESSSPRTTLALASSCPVRHSDGSSAECAGRNSVAAIVDSTASAYTTATGPDTARHRGRGGGHAADGGHEDEDPLAASSVHEGRQQRGQEGRRQHPEEADQAERRSRRRRGRRRSRAPR